MMMNGALCNGQSIECGDPDMENAANHMMNNIQAMIGLNDVYGGKQRL